MWIPHLVVACEKAVALFQHLKPTVPVKKDYSKPKQNQGLENLKVENCLLNCEDDKEAKDNDELGHWVVEVHLVLVLDLVEHLGETLLNVRHEIKQAGCYEDPASKT